MSQAKVDAQKKKKQDVKKNIKKRKLGKVLRGIIIAAIIGVVVGWVGYSIYTYYKNYAATKTTDLNIDAIYNFSLDD